VPVQRPAWPSRPGPCSWTQNGPKHACDADSHPSTHEPRRCWFGVLALRQTGPRPGQPPNAHCSPFLIVSLIPHFSHPSLQSFRTRRAAEARSRADGGDGPPLPTSPSDLAGHMGLPPGGGPSGDGRPSGGAAAAGGRPALGTGLGGTAVLSFLKARYDPSTVTLGSETKTFTSNIYIRPLPVTFLSLFCKSLPP
jgi:hypothetical protein